MDLLYKQNHAGRMWNLIRKSKNSSHSANPKVISLSTLEAYFGNKFKANEICDTDREAFEKTFLKHKNFIPYDNFTLSYIKVKNYIKQLKNDCAGGLDCLVSEHFKFGLQTKLPLILSYLFTGCIRFRVLPTAFSEGLLVPIIKKPNLDPGLPNNYRPITISSVCSKLLEYYILEV